MGLIQGILRWVGLLPEERVEDKIPPVRKPEPTPVPPPTPLPTLELFARPGHGKTTYLWSVLFILRKLNLFWPYYVCWAQDDATEEALNGIHDSLSEGLLPSESNEVRYDLRLNSMERWAHKSVITWDAPDVVFSPGRNGARTESVNWNAPALWLFSLPDLKGADPEKLDMLFDDLIRKRIRMGHAANPLPFRLVMVLTKADAIPSLPVPLRQYLKEDPVWQAVQGESSLLSGQPQGFAEGSSSVLGPQSLVFYLGALRKAHEVIQEWLGSTPAGSMLIRRAQEYHVELRFCVVSSTGSGAVHNGILQLPWTPRRVLDPLFWALELDSAPGASIY